MAHRSQILRLRLRMTGGIKRVPRASRVPRYIELPENFSRSRRAVSGLKIRITK